MCLDCFYKQVQLDGLTGPVRFNKNGRRITTEFDILNLRNNSFQKVSGKCPSTLILDNIDVSLIVG